MQAPGRHRVVVVTQDAVGERMAGPAIRSVELARCLMEHHDVVLATRHPPGVVEGVDVRSYGGNGSVLRELTTGANVVVCFGSLLREEPWLTTSGAVIVADLYDPAVFEALALHGSDATGDRWSHHEMAVATLQAQLASADVFLCASDRQRTLLIGMLTASGRVNPATHDADPALHDLIRVVPFGIPSGPPLPAARRPLRDAHGGFDEDDVIVLWGGGLYEWLDPVALVDGVARADPRVKAYFMGTAHPTPEVPAMPVASRTFERARELGVLDTRVFFSEGWVPYADRGAYLLDADVGVSLHLDHLETEFAFRTRVLDYLWAGLPVLCSAGDTFAGLVQEHQAGVVVPIGDVAGIAEALDALTDDERRHALGAGATRLAAKFHWDVVSAPLVEFCRAPTYAPDHRPGFRMPVSTPPSPLRRATRVARRMVRGLMARSTRRT